MVEPVRFAIYKSFPLGDYVLGPETLTLEGESPTVESGLAANGAVIGDRGRGGHFRITIGTVLHRGKPLSIPTAETYEVFMQRRIGHLVNARKAMGFWPTSAETVAGWLAVAEDASKAIASTAGVSPGPNVNIPCTAGTVVAENELWYIFDTNNSEAFRANAGTTTPLSAKTLVNSYDSGATMFRCTWAAARCFMLPGLRLSGDGEGSNGHTRQIVYEFLTTDDPTSGATS